MASIDQNRILTQTQTNHGRTKKKNLRSQRDHRRGHIKIPESALSECTNCHALIRPHRVCPECGFYKGVEVIEIKAS